MTSHRSTRATNGLAASQLGISLDCKKCQRLRAHCASVAPRRSYRDEIYWRRPVPSFGPENAELLVVGLAPGAHGANRTGRMFTGDRSGDWLYRALYRAGFANQAQSVSKDDGLVLWNTRITGAAHCAPPDNKPTPAEVAACRPYLEAELACPSLKVVVALGHLALGAIGRAAEIPRAQLLDLAHGDLASGLTTPWHLIFSYHPSQQNTLTGRLTEPMFDAVFSLAASLLGAKEAEGVNHRVPAASHVGQIRFTPSKPI